MTLKRFIVSLGVVSVVLAFASRYFATQKASGLNAIQRAELLAAIQAAHSATLDALNPGREGADDAASRDARAASAAAALERAYASTQPSVAAWLLPTVTSFVETVTAAQVKVMAFAINRKNRGPLDNEHAEAQTEDGRQFKQDAAPLLARLSEVLS